MKPSIATTPTLIDTLRASRTLLSTREAAALLDRSEGRLCEAARLGKVPAYRIGKDYKFDPGELANWLAVRRIAA